MKATIAPKAKVMFTALISLVLVLGLSIPIATASADPSSSELKAQAQDALDQYNALQDELDTLSQQLDEASNNYYVALDEQQAAEQKVEEAKAKVEEKTKEVEAFQGQLSDRARSMYRSGDVSFVDVIMGSSSFEEFATTWNFLEKLTENDAALIQQTKDARAELEAAQAEAEEQAQVAAEKAAEAKAVKDQAASAEAEAQAKAEEAQELYDSLSAEAEEQLKKEQEAAAAAAAAAAASSASNAKGSGSVDNSKVQTVTGNIVVDRAYAQLGKPYVWGASGPNSFDCSGLVGYCITGKFGSHWCTTYTMAKWQVVTNPQPGDFCLNSHHTGVYIGNGQMIHAPHTGDVVKISAVHKGMWYVRY